MQNFQIPYTSMVIEALSKEGWGGHRFAVDLIEESLSHKTKAARIRPWCIFEVIGNTSKLYLPAFSSDLRHAVSQRKIFWAQSTEALAPSLVHMMLESGLCEGVMVRGLE